MTRKTRMVTLAFLGIAATGFIAVAGDLNPPAGPVAPTHKTLTEVEPRIAIKATNTPGDADSLFKITQPGSYYLTGNVTGVAAKCGIEIAVPNNGPSVTIDLMGFELVGVAGSLDGIRETSGNRNVAIRNGVVRAWGGDGIDISFSQNNLLADLRVQANGARGINAGPASIITGCTAFENTGDGIFTSNGSSVTGCGAHVNGADGFSTESGCIVTGCAALANTGDGIQLNSECLVQANTCEGNGSGAGSGAGIHALGNDNRIEGNNCILADRGIDVDAAGNIIIRNTCSGNTTNWDIVANNVYGPIIDRTAPASPAVLGNAAASTLGSTDANANFSY